MYAFTDDKSKWNVGTWYYLQIARQNFVAGIISSDSEVQQKFPDKFVFKYDISNWAGMRSVCGGYGVPALIWDTLRYGTDGVYGLGELTEDEQEDAAIVEDVFFQNENLYIITSVQPINTICVRFKGA